MGKIIKGLTLLALAMTMSMSFAACNKSNTTGEDLPVRKESPAQVNVTGNYSIYSLQEAYDNGLLSQNDIMHISYFLTGAVYRFDQENSVLNDFNTWEKVDFVPQYSISELDEKTENEIKSAYNYSYPNAFKNGKGETYGTEILNVTYFGCYNGCHVARIDSDYWTYGAMMQSICIDNIIWQQNTPSSLLKVFTL